MLFQRADTIYLLTAFRVQADAAPPCHDPIDPLGFLLRCFTVNREPLHTERSWGDLRCVLFGLIGR